FAARDQAARQGFARPRSGCRHRTSRHRLNNIMASIYDLEAISLHGEPVSFDRYRGQVLLIVNTASACGFTPQYRGLEQLYQRYREHGLVVLGFPCNQFRQQEPGSAETIAEFCSTQYGVSFPMFDKIDVNGPNAHPLYQLLKQSAPGLFGSRAIKWNFTKFLVDRNGNVCARFAPVITPKLIAAPIERLLGWPNDSTSDRQV